MEPHETNLAPTEETTYCAVHPDRETGLRCNQCGRFMCVACAVRMPVGYRCRECVRGLEDRFFTATSNDYLIVFSVCAVLTGIGAAIVKATGIPLLFLILLALPAGGLVGEAALRATQRRRGRQSANIAIAGVIVGGLVGGAVQTFSAINSAIDRLGLPPDAPRPEVPLDLVLRSLITDLGLLIFIGIVAFTVYGRFRMRM